MRIRFVTGNPGKVRDARAVLEPLGIHVAHGRAPTQEIQADRLDAIARHKARQLMDRVPLPYFLEDAGLFVRALDGFPGPYSAHAYRTLGCDGLLRLLARPRTDRRARFEAVVAFVDASRRLRLFRGTCDGRIATRARGDHGFGFDPIFVPDGQRRTFAQLSPDEKGRLSHRGRALRALARHLDPSRAATKRVKRAPPVRRPNPRA